MMTVGTVDVLNAFTAQPRMSIRLPRYGARWYTQSVYRHFDQKGGSVGRRCGKSRAGIRWVPHEASRFCDYVIRYNFIVPLISTEPHF